MKPQGVVVPLITPLTPEEKLDKRSLQKVIDHVIIGGVDGVFVAGTTGEFARLKDSLRHELFALAAEFCGGRVPVYAGVSDTGLQRVRHHLKAAETAGVDAVVVSLPYYYPVSDATEARVWFEAILGLTSRPVLLYEIPGNVGASIAPATLAKLSPHIAGIKDSSGSPEQMERYIAALGGTARHASFLCGTEALLEKAISLDADGVVPSMANAFPRLWTQTWAVRHSHNLLPPLTATITEMLGLNDLFSGSLGHLLWKKRLLELVGLCSSQVTVPSPQPHQDHDQTLMAAIRRAEDVSQPCRRNA